MFCMTSQRGDHSELLQHAQKVILVPPLHHLAASDAEEIKPGKRHSLPGRRHTHYLALVCAPGGVADHDLVALGNHVLHRIVKVGKGSVEEGSEFFEARKSGW